MTRVDLDELEQKLNSAFGQDLIAESPIGELLSALVAELRAAREVVEAARQQYGPRNSLRLALEAYDEVVDP